MHTRMVGAISNPWLISLDVIRFCRNRSLHWRRLHQLTENSSFSVADATASNHRESLFDDSYAYYVWNWPQLFFGVLHCCFLYSSQLTFYWTFIVFFPFHFTINGRLQAKTTWQGSSVYSGLLLESDMLINLVLKVQQFYRKELGGLGYRNEETIFLCIWVL